MYPLHRIPALGLLAALFLAAATTGKSQSLPLNGGWQFQRLESAPHNDTIRNQGSDWASQYSVQHVNADGADPGLPPDTLRAERRRLDAGRWEDVRLPHTPAIEPLVIRHQWQGVCYYRRRLRLGRAEAGKRLWLEFEGAMQLADLWVNGRHAARHAGGYTPFVTDVSGLLGEGDNEIVVRLDNRDNPLIPPGKPLGSLDFNYYGGLYRDARLIVKDAIHITHPILAGEVAGGGIFVTYPEVSAARAVVDVRTQVANRSAARAGLRIRQTLYEWADGRRGRRAAETEESLELAAGAAVHASQRLDVERPRLWSPDAPRLYVLRTEVFEGGRLADSQETRIGIRRIELTRERGCLVNGKPVRLEGTNRHQDYPYVGYALPDQAHRRDLWQIRRNGFNTVRLGHYPQDPAVLDACDELGLLVIEPIPGWQFFNASPVFTQRTYRDVRDLVRRDRNHPSVLLWETTLNESWPPAGWKDGAVAAAHEEYPGDQCFTSGDAYGYDGFDVCYNDWEEGFNRPNRTGKAGFIREYYDYEFGGHYSTSRVGRGDGDRALVQNAWNAQWSHNRYRAYYPQTAGQAVWSMYDYNRGCCDNICQSGVADIFRLPKFSLKYFRLQQAAGSHTPEGPMPYEVFVCSHRLPGGPDTVLVYGNVDEVALALNGREIARRRPDCGPATAAYTARPDGGNATHLDFPPFTFVDVPTGGSELRATGYKDGRAVAVHTVRTPGAAAALDIDYMESGIKASRHDLLLVYVRLTDAQGTLCFGENGREVSLRVAAGGALRCPATVKAEAGIATFLVATADARRLVLEASAGNLAASRTIRLGRATGYTYKGRNKR